MMKLVSTHGNNNKEELLVDIPLQTSISWNVINQMPFHDLTYICA